MDPFAPKLNPTCCSDKVLEGTALIRHGRTNLLSESNTNTHDIFRSPHNVPSVFGAHLEMCDIWNQFLYLSSATLSYNLDVEVWTVLLWNIIKTHAPSISFRTTGPRKQQRTTPQVIGRTTKWVQLEASWPAVIKRSQVSVAWGSNPRLGNQLLAHNGLNWGPQVRPSIPLFGRNSGDPLPKNEAGFWIGGKLEVRHQDLV